jgi:hypothetical protein
MPNKVTKYTCGFKCGRASNSSINNVIAHEKKCVNNPINKTCNTCINKVYYTDGDDYRFWRCRGCKITVMNDFIEDIHNDLLIAKSASGHINPLFNCPNHNQSEIQPETDAYIVEVKTKIENKKAEIQRQKEASIFNF